MWASSLRKPHSCILVRLCRYLMLIPRVPTKVRRDITGRAVPAMMGVRARYQTSCSSWFYVISLFELLDGFIRSCRLNRSTEFLRRVIDDLFPLSHQFSND